jgi:hypothetical protein
MTSGYIAINTRLLEDGLKQSMLHLKTLLDASTVVKSIMDDEYRLATSLYHIDQVIDLLFKGELKLKFKDFDFSELDN